MPGRYDVTPQPSAGEQPLARANSVALGAARSLLFGPTAVPLRSGLARAQRKCSPARGQCKHSAALPREAAMSPVSDPNLRPTSSPRVTAALDRLIKLGPTSRAKPAGLPVHGLRRAGPPWSGLLALVVWRGCQESV